MGAPTRKVPQYTSHILWEEYRASEPREDCASVAMQPAGERTLSTRLDLKEQYLLGRIASKSAQAPSDNTEKASLTTLFHIIHTMMPNNGLHQRSKHPARGHEARLGLCQRSEG